MGTAMGLPHWVWCRKQHFQVMASRSVTWQDRLSPVGVSSPDTSLGSSSPPGPPPGPPPAPRRMGFPDAPRCWACSHLSPRTELHIRQTSVFHGGARWPTDPRNRQGRKSRRCWSNVPSVESLLWLSLQLFFSGPGPQLSPWFSGDPKLRNASVPLINVTFFRCCLRPFSSTWSDMLIQQVWVWKRNWTFTVQTVPFINPLNLHSPWGYNGSFLCFIFSIWNSNFVY